MSFDDYRHQNYEIYEVDNKFFSALLTKMNDYYGDDDMEDENHMKDNRRRIILDVNV